MLAGNSTGSEPDEGNIWIEVKSLKQTPGFNGWSRWNMANRKGTSNHRQYYLDRVASTDNPLRNWVGTDKVASDYQWWLQDFQRKKQNIRSYNKTELKKIHEKVRVLPNSAGNGESYSSVGKTRADYKQPLVEVQAKLQLFNVKTWLLNNARTRLLDGIDADAIKELIEDSSSF